MDWTRSIDAYCERTDPSYWAEPVNALTNAAFVIAAAVVWRRGARGIAGALCVILALIGVGSFLFHTHATPWASAADTTPIAVYILVYVYAANRHFWGLSPGLSALGAVAFIPYAAALTPMLVRIPFLAISSVYWTVLLLIAAYALALRRRLTTVAGGLAVGVAILTVSLVFRSLDAALCDAIPVGTHFMWHLLNALMLGWMIDVLRRHMVEAALSRR